MWVRGGGRDEQDMRDIWRRGAVMAALVLATAFVVVPAQADTAEGYLGTSAGRALHRPVGGIPVPLTDTVKDFLEALGTTQTAAIRIGKSVTDVTAQQGVVTSTGSAAGGQVDILPQGGLNGLPVASIIVGDAHAVSAYDRSTGVSTAQFTPAIATIRLSTPALSQEIPVRAGQTVCILDGTPLESCVIAGDGRTSTAGGKSVAVADGVKLDLLQGVSGGVVLELAHAEAGVEGTPASKAS